MFKKDIKIGPLTIGSRAWWRVVWYSGSRYGIFRNKRGIYPGRWGFYLLGIEFGSRDPRNKFGLWLNRMGLWRW